MSLFIYLYRRPRRVNSEDACKVFYLLLALMSATLLLVTFADWVDALSEIFDKYWGSREAVLRPRFEAVLNNCSYTDSITIGREVETTATYESRMYVIMGAVQSQNTVFGLTWSAVVLGIFNKFMFRGNWWHFRWRGLIIPTSIILPTLEFLLDVMAITAIVDSFGPCGFAKKYIEHCTADFEMNLRRQTGYAQAVYVSQPFEIEFVSLLIIICINLATMLFALIYLILDASKKDVRDWARTMDEESHWKPPYGWEPLDEEDGADTGNQDDPNNHIVPPRRFLRNAIKRYPKQVFRGCPAEVINGRIAEGEPTVLEEVLRSATRLGLAQEVMRWMVGAPVSTPPFLPGRSLRPPPPEIPVKRVRVVRQEMQLAPDTVLPAEEVTLTVGPGGPDPEGLLRLGVLMGHAGLSHSGFLGRLVDKDETAGKTMRLDRFADQDRDIEGMLQLCSILAGRETTLDSVDGGTVQADQIAQVDRSYAYSKSKRRPHTDLFWVPDPAEIEFEVEGGGPVVNAADVSVGQISGLQMSPAVYSPRQAERWPPTSADVEADEALRRSYKGLGVVTNDDI
eukprot:Hpha_TRINITY_DN16641_c2_g1::TRINITY_DN16641_c2_g1_i1::g.178361::m.178361